MAVVRSREMLVLLDAGRSQEALAALRAAAEVHATLLPRLALVAAPGGPGDVGRMPGVVGVYDGELPPARVMDAMNDTERLFVLGWGSRDDADQPPPGSGEDWDTPGRQPPDPPRHRA